MSDGKTDAREFLLANKQGTGAQSDADVIAAAAGYSYEIHWACISVSADALVQLTAGADAAGTRLIDTYLFVAGNSLIVYAPACPFLMDTNTALKITTSAGNVKVSVHYVKVPF